MSIYKWSDDDHGMDNLSEFRLKIKSNDWKKYWLLFKNNSQIVFICEYYRYHHTGMASLQVGF
ncbi:protein of unknown function [Xenorhabdus poinarii G6]|uniref:Uncharacterized protein n=1 Tax=Xenorhabdus poinarii G6 TaxID=1354304 RepID=A0A068R4G1_9GAMM|nr:protein of unknown function [Xenorhabdus poinarii G6]